MKFKINEAPKYDDGKVRVFIREIEKIGDFLCVTIHKQRHHHPWDTFRLVYKEESRVKNE